VATADATLQDRHTAAYEQQETRERGGQELEENDADSAEAE
jgi:hypothetical protein